MCSSHCEFCLLVWESQCVYLICFVCLYVCVCMCVHCVQNPEQLFETISQALLNAVDRDAVSGWGGVVHVMYVCPPCSLYLQFFPFYLFSHRWNESLSSNCYTAKCTFTQDLMSNVFTNAIILVIGNSWTFLPISGTLDGCSRGGSKGLLYSSIRSQKVGVFLPSTPLTEFLWEL